jgi:dephospho-CoA kinase
MLVIGLTGSIAMGKSTVGGMLAAMGAPIFDSDAAVHAFYRSADARRVEAEFPGVLRDGVIDRGRLAKYVLDDNVAMARLEAIVHPVVNAARASFLREAAGRATRVVIDSPLLLETGAENSVDLVVVVSAPAAVQQARVLARPGMTLERCRAILARQMPDREKRRRAHFVIDTGGLLTATQAQAKDLMRCTASISGRSR